ncbi:MAG: hypothetical protein QY318_03045 [Candidatus Dojkabacteria bacterium]|nr:MAG: hypothetical protein QY318_03045 [Candidatus Dojkabacteria bacterium]
MGLISRYKREFVYAVILFIIWEISQVPEIIGVGQVYFFFSFIGLLLVVTWIFTTYFRLSYKKVSDNSDALIKIRNHERFFINFILPLLFYCLVSYFLYVSVNLVLTQLLIILSSMLFFVIFVNIKNSYTKVFTIERDTRTILSFLDIIVFFLAVTLLTYFGDSFAVRVLGVSVAAFILLGHQLLINKQQNWAGFAVLVASTIFLGAVAYFFMDSGSYLFPLVMSILFYLVVALWTVKLSGTSKLSDYLPPLLFALMAFIIVTSF